ncbi:dynamin family protein [Acetivibrio ethanolgignens]|uniref:Dynamin N-terminal domain-containing protein n=1 Tax=Acetivibrio ethanolgignens TaxID=290052 RepID=A0A0V8QIK2_9FIRM|nr:dynamin family protein [Acetivibrio ethanolgignens]KSV60389.1 hypothetical protein ASU35_05360 [Acetivibrio ethanolgignens]
MTRIKIVSNPYERSIKYFAFNEFVKDWEDIRVKNPNSRLREDESGKSFLPFKIKEIVDIIIHDYHVGAEKVELYFDGTQDEYEEIYNVCNDPEVSEKISLFKTEEFLENARDILKNTKECFERVHPIIEKIVRDDAAVIRNLNKVSDALDDIIPICVFGNYSAGKSTFINALIGSEVLTCGGTVVTAKIYRIERSSHEDRARIKFTFREKDVELFFENTNFRVMKGDNELVDSIKKAIEESKEIDMFVYVKIALDLINGYEKKEKEEYEIGNVIQLEIPFSRNGILGSSQNKFVIFDTPGSNSNSNTEHSKVLAEALDGFSNGIPVWVSTYENLDTNDNADLCSRILEIKALDKRFTMIVCNRADQADLEGECLGEAQVSEILEYNSVEEMYASGIYFVSSIMGIGSKNNGELTDKFYKKIYRQQIDAYEDPEDEYYTSLYKFNIMPEQIKKRALEYSADCTNLVYANSGLFCIEKEMESFASRHAAYNKCQMVYIFLNDVIDETNKRIEYRTESLKRTREARKRELESAKAQLIELIMKTESDMDFSFEKAAKTFVKELTTERVSYSHTVEEIDAINDKVWQENAGNTDIERREEAYEESRSSMWDHLKTNSKSLFKGNVISSVKSMATELARDYKDVQEQKDRRDTVSKDIDKATSDRVIRGVVHEYKKNTLAAKDEVSAALKEYWLANAQELRNRLVEIITETDALTSTQREELQTIIMNYEPLEFNDDADNIFIKARFLRGNFLGLRSNDSEKLNTKRLTDIYNDRIRKNIKEIAVMLNESCLGSFRNWVQKLQSVIEQNITDYNPRLRDMADMIREETEKIAELEEDQRTIGASLEAIKELMSWKTLE